MRPPGDIPGRGWYDPCLGKGEELEGDRRGRRKNDSSKLQACTSTLRTMHIIVCSNRPLIFDAVSLAFHSRQPRLTFCESGLEVLGVVEVVDADLLVLDTQTPGLNGLLIISAIRELAPGLPILAVSAKAEEDARAFSHKGVSFARVLSGSGADAQGLAAALTQVGEMSGIGLSFGGGSR